MARVKIELPEKFIFKTEIPIRIDDINYGGHLGNDTVLFTYYEACGRIFVFGAFQKRILLDQ